MPGDICFNCGRLSTLLVTPRLPRKLTEQRGPAVLCSATALKKSLCPSTQCTFQKDERHTLLSARETKTRALAEGRAFDCQLIEVDNLLDERERMARGHTLAANNKASTDGRSSTLLSGRCTHSSRLPSSSSSVASAVSSPRSSLLSTAVAVSDIYDCDGRPRADVVARWRQEKTASGGCEAVLTRRGVDCRLRVGGRVVEWVVFL